MAWYDKVSSATGQLTCKQDSQADICYRSENIIKLAVRQVSLHVSRTHKLTYAIDQRK